jgi:glycosyltransferase involved in cell wall biosynthesis
VPYNRESFTNAIVELLNNPNKSEKMGANGRKWVSENRSYEKLAEKVEKAYFDLLNPKR